VDDARRRVDDPIMGNACPTIVCELFPNVSRERCVRDLDREQDIRTLRYLVRRKRIAIHGDIGCPNTEVVDLYGKIRGDREGRPLIVACSLTTSVALRSPWPGSAGIIFTSAPPTSSARMSANAPSLSIRSKSAAVKATRGS